MKVFKFLVFVGLFVWYKKYLSHRLSKNNKEIDIDDLVNRMINASNQSRILPKELSRN